MCAGIDVRDCDASRRLFERAEIRDADAILICTLEVFSEISTYKRLKGSIQFPLDKPLPAGLIRQIVRFRVTGEKQKRKNDAAMRV